jgi:hypothetical protein
LANYIAHYRKKLEKLARREADLVRALERDATDEELKRASEIVRASKVRVFEAQRAQNIPCDRPEAVKFPGVEQKMQEVMEMSMDEIISAALKNVKRRRIDERDDQRK